VTSNNFTRNVFQNFLAKPDFKLGLVKKIDDDIYFEVTDYINGYNFNERYRKVNLTNFELTNDYYFIDLKPIEVESDEVSDLSNKEIVKLIQHLEPTKGNYFFTYTYPNYKNKMYSETGNPNSKKIIKSLSIIDPNFNPIWTFEVDPKEKFYYSFEDSDPKVMIFDKTKFNGSFTHSIAIFDYEKGYVNEFLMSNDKYKYNLIETDFTSNEIILLVSMHEAKLKKFDSDKIIGYAQIKLDKSTGKKISEKYLFWNNLSKYIQFKDNYGLIKDYGKIYMQDYISLKNGNAIIVAEGYKTASNSKLLDLFIIEVDSNFKVKYFKKVEKNHTTFKGMKITGSYFKVNQMFDYYYSQKLDNDDNFVMFYANNVKEGSNKQKQNNPEWILGIMTYVDGEFNFDQLKLTNDDYEIIPGKAKNGYIRLLEKSKDNVNLRLEKINY